MDSHYVGRHLCAVVGPRTCAEARDSKGGKNPIYSYYHAVEVGHEMEKQLTFGVLAYSLDVKQLPEVASVR